jgi:adenosylmethionine-8-amino-7-oxononanoate aminotransferase
VRGIGLMACVELVADKEKKTPMDRKAALPAAVQEATFRNGAMVRVSGGNLILSPPLVIQQPEIDIIVDALEKALEQCNA